MPKIISVNRLEQPQKVKGLNKFPSDGALRALVQCAQNKSVKDIIAEKLFTMEQVQQIEADMISRQVEAFMANKNINFEQLQQYVTIRLSEESEASGQEETSAGKRKSKKTKRRKKANGNEGEGMDFSDEQIESPPKNGENKNEKSEQKLSKVQEMFLNKKSTAQAKPMTPKPTEKEPVVVKTRSTPYQLEDLNVKVFQSNVKAKNPVRVSCLNGKTTINCDYEDREAVEEYIANNKVQGHTFLCKQEKYTSRLIKGIDGSFDEEDVLQNIKEQLTNFPGDHGLIMINRFRTASSVRGGRILPMMIVKTIKKETMDLIMGLNYICHSRVVYTKMERSTITQCFNCFRFGHSKLGGCFYERRCKRCTTVEENHVCSIPEASNYDYSQYTCVLCGQKGHPPTYINCPYRKSQ